MTDRVKINRGLKGKYIERLAVIDIDGSKGELSYRSYSIHDLAAHATFQEVAFLFFYGELPTRSELIEFDTALESTRTLPELVFEIIHATKEGHPMYVLRTAVSDLAVLEPASQSVMKRH